MHRHLPFAAFLLCALLQSPQAEAQERHRILVDEPAQTLLGFGGSQVFELERWVDHPTPGALYDLLIDDLGLDILRLEMAYERPSLQGGTWQDRMDDQLELLAEAAARGVTTTMLTSWSPPAYLKDNLSVAGGTLARDAQGDFVYDRYADWWVEGMLEYGSRGVFFDYVSPQNEPVWTDVYPTCKFEPAETPGAAGYIEMYQAFRARLAQEPTLTPLLMACESAGYWDLDSYLALLGPLPWIDAWTHHMYGLPWTVPTQGVPLQRALKSNWGDRPVFQTEYSSLGSPLGWKDGVHLAHHIHNVLVEEGAEAFLFWSLLWRDGPSEMDGLVQVFEPGLQDPTIIVRSCYWGLKHFSHFLGRGDQRVNIQPLTWTSLRVSAYERAEDGVVVVVIVNPATGPRQIVLELQGMEAGDVTGVLSTDGNPFAAQSGLAIGDVMTMPAESILTLEVQEAPPPCGPRPGCLGVPNSTGHPATVSGIGSGSIAANDLTLVVEGCPQNTFGLMFLGQGPAQAPLGNGIRCVDAPLFRMPAISVDAAGTAMIPFDPSNTQTQAVIDPGSTWTFQFWFRDVAAGGAYHTVSGSLDVTFCP